MESANDPKKFSILGNYDNKIFWPVAILYGCIIAYAIIDPSGAGATFSSIQRFIIAHFSWLILLTGASAIFFSVWMACSSRFATVKPALRSELGAIRLAAVRRRWMGYRVCGLSP